MREITDKFELENLEEELSVSSNCEIKKILGFIGCVSYSSINVDVSQKSDSNCSSSFIWVITDAKLVGEIYENQPIYEIVRVKLYPIVSKSKVSSDAYDWMKCIKKYFCWGFYYSLKHNLLLSKETFYWNYNMYKNFNVPERWRLPCMQGYINIAKEQIIGNKQVIIFHFELINFYIWWWVSYESICNKPYL